MSPGYPPPPPPERPSRSAGATHPASLPESLLQAPGADPIPWEDRDRLSIGVAFVENLKLFVTDPRQGFRRAAQAGTRDVVSPLLWTLILFLLSAAVSLLWNSVLTLPLQALLGQDSVPHLLAFAGGGMLQLFLAPLRALVMLFISAALFHLSLAIVSGLDSSSAGYEGTLRTVGYAHTSQVANVIPVVGPLVALIWFIVLLVIGLEETHRTTQGRAIIGALLPILVCCGLCGLLFAVLGAAGAVALSELLR